MKRRRRKTKYRTFTLRGDDRLRCSFGGKVILTERGADMIVRRDSSLCQYPCVDHWHVGHTKPGVPMRKMVQPFCSEGCEKEVIHDELDHCRDGHHCTHMAAECAMQRSHDDHRDTCCTCGERVYCICESRTGWVNPKCFLHGEDATNATSV